MTTDKNFQSPQDNTKPFVTDALSLFALSAFAITQPLYGFFAPQAGYFTAQKATTIDLLVFVSFFSLLLPFGLVLLKTLSGMIHQKIGKIVLLTLIMFLTTLVAMTVLKNMLIPDTVIIALAVIIGSLSAYSYNKIEGYRSLLSFASIACVIFLMLFLFNSSVTPMLFQPPQDSSKVKSIAVKNVSQNDNKLFPVVLVVLDELPISTLLDEAGAIDAVRYPNFARLASQSNWYKNTYSVGGSTLWAVPAILSGQMPTKETTATQEELETNLFTLLSDTHTQKNVVEKYTTLCPKTLCKKKKKRHIKDFIRSLDDLFVVYLHLVSPPEFSKNLPDVSHNWSDFKKEKATEKPKTKTRTKTKIKESVAKSEVKPEESQPLRIDAPTTNPGKKSVAGHQWGLFEKFVNRIVAPNASEKPSLNFMHIVFPHVPYNYMPSGKYYRKGPYKYFSTWNSQREIVFDYQRHLLQTGAADSMVGLLLDRLESEGMLDKSLVVIVADHGASWTKVGDERRALNADNYQNNAQDFVKVPLFIKLPQQTEASQIDTPAKIIDVLPTVADLMGMMIQTDHIDGESLLKENRSQFKTVNVIDNAGGQRFDVPVSTGYMSKSFENKIKWFGSGANENIFKGIIKEGNQPACEIGGKSLASLNVNDSASEQWQAQLHGAENYKTVDLEEAYIPTLVEGVVESTDNTLPDNLAIAVNGTVWNCYPYWVKRDNSLNFGAMIPESSLTQGQNDIKLYVIKGSQLTEIPVVSVP